MIHLPAADILTLRDAVEKLPPSRERSVCLIHLDEIDLILDDVFTSTGATHRMLVDYPHGGLTCDIVPATMIGERVFMVRAWLRRAHGADL